MAITSPIHTLAAGVITTFGVTPFTRGYEARVSSAGAGILYGVDNPGRWNANIGPQVTGTQRTVQIGGDGTTVAFTATDYPTLATAHVDSGTLAVEDNLRVVVQLKGTNGVVLETLTRVAASATLTAGQFKTSGSAPITLTVFDAPVAGTYLDVWVIPAAEVVAVSGTLTANVPKRIIVNDVMIAKTAAITIEQIGHGGV